MVGKVFVWNIHCTDFRLYDKDDSGLIDMEEMTKFSSYLYQIEGESEVLSSLDVTELY